MGEIAVHIERLRAAAETMAAGYPAGRPFQKNTSKEQNIVSDIVLCLGDDASVIVKHRPRRHLPDPLSVCDGFPLRVHRCR